MFQRSLRRSSLAALVFCALNYALFLWLGWPLATDRIAEWIMARTPNDWAVLLLTRLGEWAKPLAATGGLAAIGAAAWLAFFGWELARQRRQEAPAAASPPPEAPARGAAPSRRELLTPLLMASGTALVASESFLRNRAYAARAIEPQPLYRFHPPADTFGEGLVRPFLTPVEAFYGMSKNTVDPVVDPREWKLEITLEGRPLRTISYAELFSLPRFERITTMRCVSNTLRSNLMGTAEWSGISLRQLIDPARVPSGVVEVAFLGIDGHDDSLATEHAFSDDVMLALGMNGMTLNRTHGFPLRLVAPKYYGFKSVKWLREIRLVTRPYFGTWPKMGYTKEPTVHTGCFIDRVRREGSRLRLGGVAFAGIRGVRRVEVRADGGPWVEAQLETPMARYTWTRWKAVLEAPRAEFVEARAQDGEGRWQAEKEKPLFPDGVAGPTIKRIS
ncbi:MAG: molybdopterin-dependent oxidoreductase [Bryobacteraceae bacterium]|nr:molybdopterin-dependent oxidoreductase [Bryobacteraceae bacterium]